MALITCEHVCLGYDGQTVLRDVNFTVSRGDLLCVVGENGSGKSTLIKGLLGLKAPEQGSITLGDGLVRNEIGYLPQQTQLQRDFPASVAEVVRSGCINQMHGRAFYSRADRARAQENMERMGIEDLAGCSYQALSGGQQQRVLLARAICQQPRVLILDEPTSFLDIHYKLELLTILKNLVRERSVAVVLSLHELDLAQKISDRVICVANGEIARVGTPEEVFTDGSVQRLYGLTAGSYDERFGSLELEPVRGTPQALVIGGGGSGIALYRALQRHGIPFAAGVLHENDMDFPVARALACEIVSEQPYQPIGDAAQSRARALMHACRCVYAPLRTFGPMNEGNRLLIAEAAENGWLVSAISPKKPDAT